VICCHIRMFQIFSLSPFVSTAEVGWHDCLGLVVKTL